MRTTLAAKSSDRYVLTYRNAPKTNPLVTELITTNAIPYDREFPGQMHNNIAFLSFPIPTIMEFPDEIEQVFVESLEPRWFYGYKSFSETSIGAVPGAVANAIYNATGVRVTHPITAEGILMGLKKPRGVTLG